MFPQHVSFMLYGVLCWKWERENQILNLCQFWKFHECIDLRHIKNFLRNNTFSRCTIIIVMVRPLSETLISIGFKGFLAEWCLFESAGHFGVWSWQYSWCHFIANSIILGIVIIWFFLRVVGSSHLNMSFTEQCMNNKFFFTTEISIRDITNASEKHIVKLLWRKHSFMNGINLFVMVMQVSVRICAVGDCQLCKRQKHRTFVQYHSKWLA